MYALLLAEDLDEAAVLSLVLQRAGLTGRPGPGPASMVGSGSWSVDPLGK